MAAICLALYPQVFEHVEYGISAFGAVAITQVPFYVGLTLTAAFTAMIGWQLRQISRPLSYAFLTLGVLILGIAISCYPFGGVTYYIHWTLVCCLAICISATLYWVVRQGKLDTIERVLVATLGATLLASVIPPIYHLPIIRVFIPREILIFISSLWIFGRAALRLQVRYDKKRLTTVMQS